MPTLQELLAQRAQLQEQIQALDAQINTQQQEQKAAVIAEMLARMREAGIAPQELIAKSGGSKNAATKGKRVPVKYRNTATGDSWSGRGKQPNWLKQALAAGRKLDDFAV